MKRKPTPKIKHKVIFKFIALTGLISNAWYRIFDWHYSREKRYKKWKRVKIEKDEN